MASLPRSPSVSIHLFSPPNPTHLYPLSFRTNSLLQRNPSLPLKIRAQAQSHSKPPQNLLQNFTNCATFFALGSFFLIERFLGKPALALDFPTNLSSPLKQKSSSRQERERDETVKLYERVLEENPNDLEALKIVLYGKLRKGKMSDALDCIERLIVLEPGDVEWRLLQAVAYERMGRISKAKNVYQEILEEMPLFTQALHGLALTMHKNHEAEEAFVMLEKALELAKTENRVTEERNIKILIAMMHIVQDDLDGALKRFDDLITENPRDFRPYLCQGIIYSLMDKKKEAADQFEIYQNLVPDEFPQRGFLENCILVAKTEPRERLRKELVSEFSYKK